MRLNIEHYNEEHALREGLTVEAEATSTPKKRVKKCAAKAEEKPVKPAKKATAKEEKAPKAKTTKAAKK